MISREDRNANYRKYRAENKDRINAYYRQYYKEHREVINLQRKVNYAKKGGETRLMGKYKPRVIFKRVLGWVIKNNQDEYLIIQSDTSFTWTNNLCLATLLESKELAKHWLPKFFGCRINVIELKERIGEQQLVGGEIKIG